jgi:hypothetical protein
MYEVEPLLVNKQDAAKMLGIGQGGLDRLIRTGLLPTVLLGPKTTRIPVASIKLLIAQGLEGTGTA